MELFEGVNLYDWVTYFRELSLLLVDIAKDVNNRNTILRDKASQIFDPEHVLNKYEIIDPFSFTYALAQKNNVNRRVEIYQNTIDAFSMNAGVPTDTIFPSPANNAKVCFYSQGAYIDRVGNRINENVLWDTFTDAVNGNIGPANFQEMLSLKGVRITKFSQVLFLINPEQFWSIDENSLWLPVYNQSGEDVKNGIENAGIGKYLEVLNFIRSFFPNCKFYEINLLCWLLSGDDPQLMITGNYCQISSKLEGSDGDDHFDEFVKSSAVWPGDDGKHLGGYGLSKVQDGDIVLIRRGTRNLGGIGIIIQNEYETDGYTPDKAIYIIWLNKESRKLDYGLGDWKGFNEKATDDTYEKFYGKYSDTLVLIDKLSAKQQNIPYEEPLKKITSNNMSSLNTILYGPPGTGKTYNTVIKAAEILKGSNYSLPERYNEARDIFRNNLYDQIEFITFHQNYTYEDFLAGLRPDIDPLASGLRFKEHKGVFYKLCERATKNYEESNSGKTYTEPSFEEVLNEFLKPLAEKDEAIQLSTIARNVSFKIYQINDKNLGMEKQSGSKDHTLSISTLKGLYEGKREYNLQGLGVYYYPTIEKLKSIAIGLRKEVGKIELENYVLIIDEINRANISRVFGEMITLLEPDKRLGAKHELKLRLPGLPDDEPFSVPPNLYIVATMNTADKSIALIDIALRRRFTFVPMYPNNDLVSPVYKQFFIALNESILQKKGADFLIGHSYLMDENGKEVDFESAMNFKIIPLLNEYFFSNKKGAVFSILEPLKVHVSQYEFIQDPYIGAICKKI